MATEDNDTGRAMLPESQRIHAGRKKKKRKAQTKLGPSSEAPIDRGWAWVILIAASFEMFIAIGMMKCFGIFFVQFQKKYTSTSSETSLVVTFQSAAFSLVSLPVMTIGLRVMTFRSSVLIGGTIMSISHILSSVAEDIRILYFSQGILYGAGFAFIQPPMMTALGVYFDKRRGFANNIAQMGVGLGGLVLAPLLTKLFHEFGYSGSMLIVAGLMLNILISGALLRPLEYYTGDKQTGDKHKQKERKTVEKFPEPTKRIKHKAMTLQYRRARGRNDSIDVGGQVKDKIPLQFLRFNSHTGTGADQETEPVEFDQEVSPLALDNAKKRRFWHKMSASSSESSEEDLKPKATQKFTKVQPHLLLRSVSTDPEEHMLANSIVPRYRTASLGNRRQRSATISGTSESRHLEPRRSNIARFASYEFVSWSLIDTSLPDRINTIKEEGDEDMTFVQIVISNLKRFFSILFDVNLLKKPTFLLFLASSTFLCAGCSTVGPYLAPHAKDIGIDDNSVSLMLSVMCAVDLLSRILFGLLSDTGWIRRSNIMAVSSIVLGVACVFLHFVTSFASVMIFSVVTGLFQGVYFGLYPVVIVDYLSVDNLQNSLGFTVLFQGVGGGIAFPVVGILRDATGTYVASYIFIAAALLIGSGSALLLPVLQHRVKQGEAPEDAGEHKAEQGKTSKDRNSV